MIESLTNKFDYKDALQRKHVIAYSLGHMANDLIYAVWNAYATLFLYKAVELSDYNSGLAVLIAQVADAFFEPILGYLSDRIETRFGKRIPIYVFGHFMALTAFYFLFNPPDFAIGTNISDPKPNVYYFLILPALMQMGQGGI